MRRRTGGDGEAKVALWSQAVQYESVVGEVERRVGGGPANRSKGSAPPSNCLGEKRTMGLALPPLRISHRHGGLAQGGVDRAGVDAEMYSHRRKGQPGGVEALCLPDVGRL